MTGKQTGRRQSSPKSPTPEKHETAGWMFKPSRNDRRQKRGWARDRK